jgi:predicted RND superfamily exporter protein
VEGSFLIFADMFDAIGRDGPVATMVSLLAVIVLSLLLARGARGGVTVTVSLLVGVLWTVGIAAIAGMRLNFLNFIALPITFGIGVDYAANVYGRYRLAPGGADDIVRAVSSSGAAVAACSATTVIGYSSLLFSRNGALFSFGLLAVLGELACLAAALLVMPALLRVQLESRPALTGVDAAERLSRLGGP